MFRVSRWALVVGAVALFACAEDDENVDEGGSGEGSGKPVGEGPCETASDCAGEVCIALIDGDNPPVYCTQTCGDCPSGFYCDGDTFALAGLSFCRYGETLPMMMDPPEAPPRLPCKSDDDCDGALVCATWMGERGCTLPCTGEDDCTFGAGGITFDLATCTADESAARMVCVPDTSCYPNVQSCIGGLPGGL